MLVKGQNGFFAKSLGFETIGDIYNSIPKDLFIHGAVGDFETMYLVASNFFASRTAKKITQKHVKGIILEYLKHLYYGRQH
jgi:hypothetical protein